MNRIFLIGNLCKDPELRATGSGVPVCSFSIAVNRKFAKENDITVQFYKITAWRGLAETCAKYLEKGKKIAVTGELVGRIFDGKNGKPMISLEVTADEIEFLSPRGEVARAEQDFDAGAFTDIESDEIPF